MSVGLLIQAQAHEYIRNGRDMHEWTLFAAPDKSDEARRFVQNKRNWSRPLETEAGLYVLVDRLFRKSLCYHLHPWGERTEESVSAVNYPPAFGAYGIVIAPAESIPYNLRTHFTNVDFLGRAEYELYRETGDKATLVLPDAVLKGKLIPMPEKVLF